MDPLQFLIPLDWLEVVGPYLPLAILVVALANAVTRFLGHQRQVRQAADGDETAVTRYTSHTVTNVVLILLGTLYLVYEPPGGMILAAFIFTMFFADFFEYEARLTEIRNNMPVERPKSALVASLLVLAYAAYKGLFFIVEPYWSQIV